MKLQNHLSIKLISGFMAIILYMGQPSLAQAALTTLEPIDTTTATQPVTDTTTATADTSSTAPEDPTITFYTSGPLDTATTTSAEETVSPTVTLTCSDGELVNDQCEKKTSTAPTCEGGSVAVDGYCPVSTYHELQCTDGTAAVGGKCSTASSYASSCPSGATAVSGTNQCTSSSLAICPSGSILEVGNHCLNLMTELYSTATCPSGSILSGGQCIKNTLALCTAGDTLQSNGQCIKTTTTAAVCAADEALTSDGQCVKTTFVQASCPDGTLETDGLCHSTTSYLPNAEALAMAPATPPIYKIRIIGENPDDDPPPPPPPLPGPTDYFIGYWIEEYVNGELTTSNYVWIAQVALTPQIFFAVVLDYLRNPYFEWDVWWLFDGIEN